MPPRKRGRPKAKNPINFREQRKTDRTERLVEKKLQELTKKNDQMNHALSYLNDTGF